MKHLTVKHVQQTWAQCEHVALSSNFMKCGSHGKLRGRANRSPTEWTLCTRRYSMMTYLRAEPRQLIN